MTIEEKDADLLKTLQRVENLLVKIEHHLAPPPLWMRLARFLFQHFTVILTLFALVYFTWQIWDTITAVSENVGAIRDSISGFGGSAREKIEGIKFW